MKTVTISNAKATLSKLVQMAKAGQPVLIGVNGQPEVILQAFTPPPATKRKPGTLKGKMAFKGSEAKADEAARKLFEE